MTDTESKKMAEKGSRSRSVHLLYQAGAARAPTKSSDEIRPSLSVSHALNVSAGCTWLELKTVTCNLDCNSNH